MEGRPDPRTDGELLVASTADPEALSSRGRTLKRVALR
jgi:hypothetical protein